MCTSVRNRLLKEILFIDCINRRMNDFANLSDEELVGLTRNKDEQIYSQIVRRYQDKLLRYAGLILADDEEAEDVVQLAFIKAYKNLRSFNIQKKFSSWIYRIVHNEACNLIKKNKRQLALEKNLIYELERWSGVDIEGNLEEEEIKNKITACLKKLPAIYKEALVLYYFEEKSYEEISDILRVPVGTVGTRISRGKAILKRLCRKEESVYGQTEKGFK